MAIFTSYEGIKMNRGNVFAIGFPAGISEECATQGRDIFSRFEPPNGAPQKEYSGDVDVMKRTESPLTPFVLGFPG